MTSKTNRYEELDRATRMVVDHMINALASWPGTARDAALAASLTVAEYNDAYAATLDAALTVAGLDNRMDKAGGKVL